MLDERHMRPACVERTSLAGADIRVVVFGGLEIQRASRPTGALVGQRKCLALLAVLAVRGRRGMARDKLMALLGPEADTEHARNALSQVIFRVRRALGQGVIEGKEELVLNANQVTSDIGDFERALAEGRLEDAVECYRGPFLDGFYLRDAREFEQWTAELRARLEQGYVAALGTLASAAYQCGDVAGAVAWCRRRMDADPWGSLAARQLVQALVASGDRNAALRFGLSYAERIRTELDAEPDAEFSQLLHAIRAGRMPSDIATTSMAGSQSASPSLLTTEPVAAAGIPKAVLANASRKEGGLSGRRMKRAGVAVLAATVAGSALLSVSRPVRAPLVLVAPFVNATGDTSLDVASKLAATWATDAVVATGVLRVAAVGGAPRASGARGAPATGRARLLDIARRTGASAILLGELSKSRFDTVDVSIRLIRARDGATIVESRPGHAPTQSTDRLARIARDRAIAILAKLLERGGGTLLTN